MFMRRQVLIKTTEMSMDLVTVGVIGMNKTFLPWLFV